MSADPTPLLRTLAKEAALRLQAAGYIAYWAGGCVRDMLRSVPPKDYDIATNALPEQVLDLFPGAKAVGKSFGVVLAPVEGAFFEVATFRRDHAYLDGRRPEAVTFADPETDAQRRDFTINAMFYDPATDALYDFVGGRADLAGGVIRCVGDPQKRIQEDHLRMLRAVRFAATLGFSLNEATAAAIRANAGLISRVSAERIQEELTRILLESQKAGDALVLMDDLDLLSVILPEVAALKGETQPPEFHPEGDVFVHTVMMLNLMKARDTILVYSVLLHDVGKPLTAEIGPDRKRFHNHAARGAELAEAILRRLRFSAADASAIVHAVHNHMRFTDVQRMRRSTLRRLAGEPTFPVELELHRLDCAASHGDLGNYDFLKRFREEMAAEPVLPEPWITGTDIMQCGVPEGPQVGTWRKLAYDAQLEGRFGSRVELLQWLKTETGKGC